MAQIRTAGLFKDSLLKTQLAGALVLGLLLSGCASNDKLFAHYSQEFCAGYRNSVATALQTANGYVADDQVTIVEAASVVSSSWVPAVYFKRNADSLSEESAGQLRSNTLILKRSPNYKLSVRGYSNDPADTATGDSLIQRRVDAIVEYFKRKDIDQNRILVNAVDEQISAGHSSLAENEEFISRVELILLDEYDNPIYLNQKFSPLISE